MIIEEISRLAAEFMADINSQYITLNNSMFRLLLSMVLGMIVGAERKRKGQIAGVRTFALISMGSCLAMLLSIYVPQEYLGLKNGDPGRIAAQVITGIGFIGGGAMIQMKGSVRGLTTAAGIWMTAIIGMAVGVGMYLSSIGATMLILAILVLFEVYEKKRHLGQETKIINVRIKGIIEDFHPYEKLFRREGVHLSKYYLSYDFDDNVTDVNFVMLVHAGADLVPLLLHVREVAPTKSITLSSQIEL